jgi:hypothetical protein
MSPVPARPLADVLHDVAAGAATPADLHAAFLAATVYCERGERPGFRALGGPAAGLVAVYSSPEQLALARGTVPWFALTGSDLLEQLPSGYDLLLDPGGPAPTRLRPGALVRRVSVDIEREAAAR